MQTSVKLLGSFLLCFAVYYAGSIVILPQMPTWYLTIAKPFFTLPQEVFAVVWTVLSICMAISFFLILKSNEEEHKKEQARKVFYTQLLLSLFWAVAFFALKQPLLALAVIFLLWYFIKKTIHIFLPISSAAGYLFYPSLLWISYVAILNFAIAVLNF